MELKLLCFHSKDKDIVELKIIFFPGTYSQEHVQWESKGIHLHNLKNNRESSNVKNNEF